MNISSLQIGSNHRFFNQLCRYSKTVKMQGKLNHYPTLVAYDIVVS